MGYWDSLIVLGGINAILAWSLGLVVRSGQLSVGHAALAGAGGYAAGLTVRAGLPPILALLVAAVVAGLIGFLLAVVTLRLNHLFLALATLLFGEILVAVATGSDALGGAAGLAGLPLLQLLPLVGAAVLVIVLVEVLVLRGSRAELGMLLLSGDPLLVDMTGRTADRLRIQVFVASAAVAGFGGALLAFQAGVVQPGDLGFDHSLNLLVYVVVGGSTNGVGALVGGFVLTVLPRVVELDNVQQALLLGAVLVVVMLVRKDGAITRRPTRVLRLGRAAPTQDDREAAGGIRR